MIMCNNDARPKRIFRLSGMSLSPGLFLLVLLCGVGHCSKYFSFTTLTHEHANKRNQNFVAKRS